MYAWSTHCSAHGENLVIIISTRMMFAARVLNGCERVLAAAARACLYTSAALTPLEEMREGVVATWNDFIADERDISHGLAWWERNVADRYLRAGDRVLVVGCGSGRDVFAFVERGCVVTGVDPAERALRRARDYLDRQGRSALLEREFFEDWRCDLVFDVVWFSWFTYGYVPDSRRRVEMLKKAARNVSPGGVVVISYPTNPPRNRAAAVARFAQRLWKRDWVLEEGDVIGRVQGTGLFTYEHRFTRPEIEKETRAAGFYPVLFAEPIVVLKPGAANDAMSARIRLDSRVDSLTVRP